MRLPVIARQKLHMTAKPIALMRELLRPLPPGSHVIDPFMGSGSTGVAAVQSALRFTGVELDAHYFSVARQRIHEAATDAFPSSDPAPAPDSSPPVKGPHA